jgi:crossover junction endodeoxyribonuclease RuvC
VRALGIDPGTRVTGWGVVESAGPLLRHLASGTVVLAGTATLSDRLARLHAECLQLIDTWAPSVVVLERAFVARNVQSAFRIGEVRGAVLAAIAAAGVAVEEYAPASVKLAAVGHGAADKDAVGRGVTLRLGLARRPSSDAAAVALALCHLQDAPLRVALRPRDRGTVGGARERGGFVGGARERGEVVGGARERSRVGSGARERGEVGGGARERGAW